MRGRWGAGETRLMRLLITGTSSGIGSATCTALLAEGHEVFGLCRHPERFAGDNPRYHPTPVDLSDLKQLPSRLEDLTAAIGTPDSLVCNAGAGRFGELEQFSYAQISQLIDLNFTGHAFLVRAFLPLMKRAGRGRLIFVGSEAALQGRQKGAVYCASKFALRGFAQSLRAECGRAGISVSLVNPGMVHSAFYRELGFAPGSEAESHLRPDDIAQTILGVLKARPETVVDEINLSPLKRVIDFGNKS